MSPNKFEIRVLFYSSNHLTSLDCSGDRWSIAHPLPFSESACSNSVLRAIGIGLSLAAKCDCTAGRI